MATTSTARLQLLKATPGTGELVLVQPFLNDNWDKVDALGKKPEPISNPFIKRNTADAVSSGTQTVFENLTVVLKAGRWYEVAAAFRYNTTVAVGVNPTGSAVIRIKAGGGPVVNTDTAVAISSIPNCNTASPKWSVFSGPIDVTVDGTYTFGLSLDAGGVNTLNILASGGTGNSGTDRCLWVKDLGEK